MGNQDKKSIRRLQLRREVIRVLADESLRQVAAGRGGCATSADEPTMDACSPCMPSK